MSDEKQLTVMKQITEVKGIIPKLTVAGNIKIGGKGELKTSSKGNDFQLPVRFNHFKITTTEKGSDNNFIENVELTSLIKKEGGITNSDGNLIAIPIMFMFDDTNLNMPFRRARYSGGKLACQGNGEEAYWAMDNFKNPQPCPCKRGELGYTGDDKCKYHAKLTCIIEASLLFGQVFKFTTTSRNSVEGIIASIELIKKLTRGRIAGLPLMLTFNSLSTQTPSGRNTTVPVVGLAYRGSMVQIRQQSIELYEKDAEFEHDMKQIEASAIAAGEGSFFDEDDTEEGMVGEYFLDKDVVNNVVDVEHSEIKTSEVVERLEPTDDRIVDHDYDGREITHTEEKKEAHQKETGDPKEVAKLEMFNRLQGQTDQVKAIALAKRVEVKYLHKYFERYGITIEPKAKKPELIAAFEEFTNDPGWKNAVADYTSGKFTEDKTITPEKSSPDEQEPIPNESDPLLIAISKTEDRAEVIKLIETRFPGPPLNRTLAIPFLIIQAKKWIGQEADGKDFSGEKNNMEEPEKTEPEHVEPEEKITDQTNPNKDSRYVAAKDDEQVVIATITKIVGLKKKIEELDDKQKWFDLVAKFTDHTGEYVVSAKLLTQGQGDFLVELLQAKLDGIPF